MNNFVLKFSVLCWSFVLLFAAFLLIAGTIPAGAVLYVSTILGFLIVAVLGYNLRQIHQNEGFDLGWFLAVKKGYWRILVGLFGLTLFLVGLFGLIFPGVANDFGEKNWLKFAAIPVILFWVALTSTFLSWCLVCLSEAAVFWRNRKPKSGFGSFGLGILWLLFTILFLSLFLDVINDNFFSLAPTTQNWVLLIFAVLSITVGLISGRFEDFEKIKD